MEYAPLTSSLKGTTKSNAPRGIHTSNTGKSRLRLLSVIDKSGSPCPTTLLSASVRLTDPSGHHCSVSRCDNSAEQNLPIPRNRLREQDSQGNEDRQTPIHTASHEPVTPGVQEKPVLDACKKLISGTGRNPLTPRDRNRLAPTSQTKRDMSPGSLYSIHDATTGSSLPGEINRNFDRMPDEQGALRRCSPMLHYATEDGTVVDFPPTLPPFTAGTSSVVGPSDLTGSSHLEMAHDPMFRVIDRVSGSSGPYDIYSLGIGASSDVDPSDDSEFDYGTGKNLFRYPATRAEE